MSSLFDDIKAAKSLGLTYGQYTAIHKPQSEQPQAKKPQTKKDKRIKRPADQRLFELWQSGLTDSQIAACVGVSHTLIYRWRHWMELPPNTLKDDSRERNQKYCLIKTELGVFAIHEDELNSQIFEFLC